MEHFPIIVIVDDDPDDLMFIQDALENATNNFQILPFQSSEAFIEYLNASHELPVLVVLDYNMPKLNAEEILIKMKSAKHLASVKTYILSTGMNPTLKDRLLALGAYCCIAKPTTIDGYRSLAVDIIELAKTLQSNPMDGL